VYAIFGGGTDAVRIVAAGTPQVASGVSNGSAVLCEIIATFLLTFVIWGTAADPRARNVGGFAIGLTIAADILAIGPLTGASMNPQRSFGPTLIASMLIDGSTSANGSLWSTHWIYWVGPVVGALLAALLYHLALWPSDPKRGLDPGAEDVPPTQRPQ
jgi:glycerol uptake facilitator-like aquaporin